MIMRNLKHIAEALIIISILISCGNTNNKKTSSGETSQDSNSNISTDLTNTSADIDGKTAYSKYSNDRFAFSVEYPVFFVPQGESDNNDGQVFLSDDGMTQLIIYGKNMITETFKEEFDAAVKNGCYYDKKNIITEKIFFDKSYEIRGNKKGFSFYAKSVYYKNIIVTIYFEYPSSEKTKFEAIIKRVTASLVIEEGVIT